jgi:hypothetical protein
VREEQLAVFDDGFQIGARRSAGRFGDLFDVSGADRSRQAGQQTLEYRDARFGIGLPTFIAVIITETRPALALSLSRPSSIVSR